MTPVSAAILTYIASKLGVSIGAIKRLQFTSPAFYSALVAAAFTALNREAPMSDVDPDSRDESSSFYI